MFELSSCHALLFNKISMMADGLDTVDLDSMRLIGLLWENHFNRGRTILKSEATLYIGKIGVSSPSPKTPCFHCANLRARESIRSRCMVPYK